MGAKVTWYVTGSQNPYADAVQPEAAGIDIPGEVMDWASENGLDESDPDVYLLIARDGEAGEVIGTIAARDGEISGTDEARLAEALKDLEAERAERRGL